jgi:hypothetical protein
MLFIASHSNWAMWSSIGLLHFEFRLFFSLHVPVVQERNYSNNQTRNNRIPKRCFGGL